MALNYTSTNRTDIGSAAALDDMAQGTALFWVKLTTVSPASAFLKLFDKRQSGVTSLGINPSSPGPNVLSLFVQRATTNLNVTAAPGNFAALGTGKWVFIVAVWDTNGANGDQKLYVGDRATPAAEPSSYTVQTVGSGAITTNGTGNMFLGNRDNGGQPLEGDIAISQIVNRIMTQGEIRALQWQPMWVSGTIARHVHGWNGTTNVPDLSGNGNTGTITGATVSAHVPLGNWNGARAPRVPYVVAAAPGTTFDMTHARRRMLFARHRALWEDVLPTPERPGVFAAPVMRLTGSAGEPALPDAPERRRHHVPKIRRNKRRRG
jgi:hypothetical protein